MARSLTKIFYFSQSRFMLIANPYFIFKVLFGKNFASLINTQVSILIKLITLRQKLSIKTFFMNMLVNKTGFCLHHNIYACQRWIWDALPHIRWSSLQQLLQLPAIDFVTKNSTLNGAGILNLQKQLLLYVPLLSC